jgi:hypothetical protein
MPNETPNPSQPSQPEAPRIMLWDTKEHARYNVRVMCDNAGLTFDEKNIICACIRQESDYDNNAVCINKNQHGIETSRDVGIVQINTRYHIGVHLDFSSIEYVVANPQHCVDWMIEMYKEGQLGMWVSYSSGAYKQWLPEESLPGVPY